ncbi:MAG: PH domain-containing protein, partial [Candidatus Diapherotrites archaeon]|nr:PH domain-containing protein [Candidatus Diapherotrites archaeon]
MADSNSGYTRYHPSLLNLVPSFLVLFFAAAWVSLNFLRIFQIYSVLIFFLIWFGGLALTYLNLINTWIEFREEGLFIQKGIIAKKRSTLLWSQIQDVAEQQGLLQRVFGLKVLRIVTMTVLSAGVGRLPGFDNSTANTIRSTVLQRIAAASQAQTQKAAPGQVLPAVSFEPTEEMKKNIFPIQVGKAILSVFPGVIILLFLIASVFLLGPSMLLFVGIFLFIAIIAIISIAIQFSCTTYFTGKSRLEIQFKFLSFYKMNIPYEKIQDIVLSRDFLGRMVGIASLHIETGAAAVYVKGQQQMRAMNNVPALLREHAMQLRDFFAKSMGFSIREITPTLVSKIPLEASKPVKKTAKFFFVFLIIFAVIWGISFAAGSQFLTQISFYGLAFLVAITAIKFVYELFYLKSYYYNFTEDC